MTLQVSRGSFTTTAGTGTQAVSVGFQPKIVFFWCVKNTAAGFGADGWDCFGVATSSSARYCVSAYAKNGVVGSTTCYRVLSNAAIIDLDDSTTHVFQVDFTSLDSNGFTVNKLVNITGTIVHYLALGGTELTNVKVGDFAAPTTAGSFGVTGVGFKPDAVLLFGANRTAFNSTTDIVAGVGAFTSSAARWASTMYAQDATASGAAKRAQRTDSCYLIYRASDGTLLQRWDAVSMDSAGFTCNAITANASGEQVVYIALKGGRYTVGSSAKPTGAAPQDQDVGLSFAPLGALLQSFGLAATTTVSADARISRGSSDGTVHGGTWMEMQDAQANSVADHQDSTSKALTLATVASTVDAQCTADFVTVLNTLRLHWDVNNAVAAEILYLAIGGVWAKVQDFGQNSAYNGTGASSTAATLGSAVAVGDTLTLMTVYQNGSDLGSTPTVTDQLGNVYVRQSGCHLADPSDAQYADGWVCIVAHAGTPTITFDPNGSNVVTWIAFRGMHHTGSNSLSVVDGTGAQNTQAAPGTGADAITSTAFTTATDGDLIVGYSEDIFVQPGATATGTGFTSGAGPDTPSALSSEWKTQTAHGSVAATFTDSVNGGTTGKYITMAMAVTPAPSVIAVLRTLLGVGQ